MPRKCPQNKHFTLKLNVTDYNASDAKLNADKDSQCLGGGGGMGARDVFLMFISY